MGCYFVSRVDAPHDRREDNDQRHRQEQRQTKHDEGAKHIRLTIGCVELGANGRLDIKPEQQYDDRDRQAEEGTENCRFLGFARMVFMPLL